MEPRSVWLVLAVVALAVVSVSAGVEVTTERGVGREGTSSRVQHAWKGDRLRIGRNEMDLRRPIVDRPCRMDVRKPRYPRPTRRRSPDQVILSKCTAGNVQRAFERLSAKLKGTLFFNCGDRPKTIWLNKGLKLAKDGRYRLVNLGASLKLDGRNRYQILAVEPGTRLEIYGVDFQHGFTRAPLGGGAVQILWRSSLLVVDSKFHGNRARSPTALGGGGAVKVGSSTAAFWNCEFDRNVAPTGGGLGGTHSNMFVFNSKFKRNYTTGGRDGSGNVHGAGGAFRADRPRNTDSKPILICGGQFLRNDVKTGSRWGDAGAAVEIWGHPSSLGPSNDLATVRDSLFRRNGRRNGSARNICTVHGWGDVRVLNTEFRENICSAGSLRCNRFGKMRGEFRRVSFVDNVENDEGLNISNLDACTVVQSTSNGKRITCADGIPQFQRKK